MEKPIDKSQTLRTAIKLVNDKVNFEGNVEGNPPGKPPSHPAGPH